jgi:FkbM family methyltransferase
VSAAPQRFGQALKNVFSPYYVYRPGQFVRRVVGDRSSDAEARLPLPWGATITCHPQESVGRGIQRRGVYDLGVCEVLLRLADPGETAVDVGANIGQMTSALAHAVKRSGRVIAFEPHPAVYALLDKNVREWRARPSAPTIEAHQEALSDRDGVAELATDVFGLNEGSASLEPLAQPRHAKDVHTVRVRRVDDVLGDKARVGVMKLDVEGHELHALRGAQAALTTGRIRDLVVEEQDEPPTPVTRLLAQHGYTLMRIGEQLRGPIVGALDDPTIAVGFGLAQSLLATLDPQRALERLKLRGWATYGVGPAAKLRR